MITLSKAKKEDIGEIKKLLSNTWVDTYSRILSDEAISKVTNTWHETELLSEQCNLEDTVFSVAKENNKKIVGIATANIKENKIVSLTRLYIAKEYQKNGIGKSFLKYITEEFSYGRKIQVKVAARNLNAMVFYIKNGFKEKEVKREVIEDEFIELVVMEKRI